MKYAVLSLLLLTGCANQKHASVRFLIDPPCLNEPVALKQCSGSDPATCKKITVKFKKGCERLDVSR